MRTTNSPIALEAIPFLVGAALLTGAAFFIWQPLALIFLAVTCFVAFFFRNPERQTPTDESSVIAPADGVVIFLGEAKEEHLNEEMLKISIFMSVFNVHINRAPISGRVVDTFYRKGKFLDVRDECATFENERSGLVLEAEGGLRIVVVQVAGLIARRIVCYARKDDMLTRGERYGLIRFGSRLDVYLPKGTDLRVAMGQKTIAGETILGILS
jgi:phosphatidylserine decarboxylase